MKAAHDNAGCCVAGITWILRGFAFALPVSIALAEPLGYLAVVAALLPQIFRPRVWRFQWYSLYWPMMAFAMIAVISAIFSVRPAVSATKLPRLLLMGLVPVLGSVTQQEKSEELSVNLVAWFIAGCAARSLYQAALVISKVPAGVNPFDLGNMRDPQMYLVAALLLLALLAFRAHGVRSYWAMWALGCVVLGLVLNFKRGAWLASLVSFLLLLGITRKWPWLLGVGLFLIALWLTPWTRQRIEQSRQEFSVRLGGRYALWTEVAPAMLRRYPQGMGYAASRNSDFLQYMPRVQPGLHHLHNNVLQVTLELGWAGLAAWLWWVLSVVGSAVKAYLRVRLGPPHRTALALGILTSLCGLLVNGMVEYNFGDSEILMLWYLLTGLVLLLEVHDETARFGGAKAT